MCMPDGDQSGVRQDWREKIVLGNFIDLVLTVFTVSRIDSMPESDSSDLHRSGLRCDDRVQQKGMVGTVLRS